MAGMLEKAARAAEEVMTAHITCGANYDSAYIGERIARAVLLAIRDATDDIGWAGAGIIQGPIGGSAKDAATSCFSGMIDAILAQPSEGEG